MRWFTHKSVTLAGAVWLGASVPALLGALVGSILPDCLDRFLAGGDRERFWRVHRGFTHWGGWYVLLIFAVPYVSSALAPDLLSSLFPGVGLAGRGAPAVQAGADVLLGIGFGALFHVILDALNPSGVPLLPWRRRPRLSLNLVATGSWREVAFLIAAALLMLWKMPEARSMLARFSTVLNG